MEHGPAGEALVDGGNSRFELAPPRRFILPALLLLLAERPGYGYALMSRLEEMRFGRIDRPAVYRALAALQADGLVRSSPQCTNGGHSRRVYELTAEGRRILAEWMLVVEQEHERLGQVLGRYSDGLAARATAVGTDG